MPLFRRNKAPEMSEEEKQTAAVDLERIKQGGIPLGAEERLKAVAAADSFVFSSDLSAKEYALAQASGLTPIAQVMGSSIVQHGWQGYRWSSFAGGVQEMPSFAVPWNLSRQRAFDRLRQEATFAGADSVINIDITANGFLGDQSNVEYMVFGTAVRDPLLPHRPGGGPRLSALSGQDANKLRRIGADTLGVIGHTSVVCVDLDWQSNRMMGSWWGNREMPQITQGVYTARRLVMDEVTRQARELGANDMVISTLRHQIQHHEYERNDVTYHFFIISMHVLGTAIQLGAHEPHPGPLKVPMMSINIGA